MSPSHRKKGSIYRQHSSTTVPPWSVSEERLVFPFQGLSPSYQSIGRRTPSYTLHGSVSVDANERCSPEVTRLPGFDLAFPDCLFIVLLNVVFLVVYVKSCSEECKCGSSVSCTDLFLLIHLNFKRHNRQNTIKHTVLHLVSCSINIQQRKQECFWCCTL